MPVRQRSHVLVSDAIKSGELKRPCLCEECGIKCPTIYAHHDDYGRPLDVRWLCPKCHGEFHNRDKVSGKRAKTEGSLAITGFIDCRVCGDPVPQTNTRAKRLYHPECKKLKNYIDAAVRAGEKIELLDDTTKRTIRGLLYSAAYQFRTPQPRDSCGRFALTSDDQND